MTRYRSLFLSTLCFVTSTYAAPLFASEVEKDKALAGQKVCGDVSVDIRAIKGLVETDAIKKEERLQSKLSDLKPELESLSYDSYRLITHKKEIIPLTSKKVVKLGAGHKLTLRPLYVKKKRVGMWMRWKDPNGLKVIDTRMHFDCGEQMLTGMEENADRGLILAIQVDPYYR